MTRFAPWTSYSTPLTAPNYFNDAACPFGERNADLTVFISAKQVNNVIRHCDTCVGEAELDAAFERTADIFDNLNEHHAGRRPNWPNN